MAVVESVQLLKATQHFLWPNQRILKGELGLLFDPLLTPEAMMWRVGILRGHLAQSVHIIVLHNDQCACLK